MSLLYRREDNSEVVEMPDDAWLQQDAMGFITLPDGTKARRCVRLEIERDKPQRAPRRRGADTNGVVVTDKLGVGAHQLAEMDAMRKLGGHTDIEFVPDPDSPYFFKARCASRAAMRRYAKFRGMVDRTGSMEGLRITPAELDQAKKRIEEKYGKCGA